MFVKNHRPLFKIYNYNRTYGQLLFSHSSTQYLSKKVNDISKSFTEEKPWTSVLHSFSEKKNTFFSLHKLNPMKFTKFRFQEWRANTTREAEVLGQRYIKQRHDILGCDLASAHFIVYRGGKVKFEGSETWIQLEDGEQECSSLPKTYVRHMYLNSVDASKLPLRYEGLANLVNLSRLKWLSFKGCPHIDNWCVDRISGEFQNTLEYLDLSDCFNVTSGALSCMYRFKNLKTLILNNIVNTREFEYSCLLLEDLMPNLSIQGVKYIDEQEENYN